MEIGLAVCCGDTLSWGPKTRLALFTSHSLIFVRPSGYNNCVRFYVKPKIIMMANFFGEVALAPSKIGTSRATTCPPCAVEKKQTTELA